MTKHAASTLIVLAIALLTACDGQDSSRQEVEQRVDDVLKQAEQVLSTPSELESKEIPVVSAADLTKLRKQAADNGKVLVIDCWATWCGSCVAMFPKLHKALKERGDRVVVISLSFDEGEELVKEAGDYLTKQDAWDNAYLAQAGSDATDAIAKALGDNWDGNILPAVFVYKPDGTTAYELLETRGEVKDWVDEITAEVDDALQDADDSPGE